MPDITGAAAWGHAANNPM